MQEAYIALGSNIDSPLEQVQSAIEAIGKIGDTSLLAQSSFYQTPPWGKTDQPDFINAVVKVTTAWSAVALLSQLQAIERAQGKKKKEQWGPRTIDCDLILYAKEIIETDIVIPHPRMKTRGFVLLPLWEIAPDMILPTGESVVALLTHCDCMGIKKLC